jgi:hypothetical protein
MAQEQFDEERLNIIKENIRNEGISPADIQGRQIASKELLSTGLPTGAGLNPENLFLLEKALNIIKPTQPVRTQSNLIPQTSMPPMYDTSPYRALDIIGAGIGKRPTQEAYFNRLETIQNERLQDEYNRRTDTPEAKNAQELLKKVFGNTLDEDIINKVSVKYLADNYPMLAQMAESKTGAISKQKKDEQAKNMMKEFFPDYKGEVNSENFNIIFSKLSKDAEAEITKKSKELERQQKLKDDKELLLYKANLDKIKKGSESSSSKNANLDKTILREMINKESGSVSFINSLKSYHDYIKKNGFNPTDPVIKSKYGSLLANYKQAESLGALDIGVMNLFNDVLQDPSSLTTLIRAKTSDDFEKQYFKTVKNLADQTYNSFLNASNVSGYTPTLLKESPSWTKPQTSNLKEGATYKDEDGKYFRVINGNKVYL